MSTPQARTKLALRASFEATLEGRVTRSLQVQSPTILPATRFAAVTAECVALYIDGYFFACICLSQAVAEGITRFIYERLQHRFQEDHKSRVGHLARAHGLSSELRKRFRRIHLHRDDYHHLNPSVPTERTKLKQEAVQVVTALMDVEQDLFAFETTDSGAILPKHPGLWSADELTANRVGVVRR